MWNKFKRGVPAPVTQPCVCFKISSGSVVVFFLRTPHKHRLAHTNRTQTRRLNANTDMYSEKINKQITNKARIHSHTHQDKYLNPRFTCPSITNTQVNGLANNVNTLNQLREKKTLNKKYWSACSLNPTEDKNEEVKLHRTCFSLQIKLGFSHFCASWSRWMFA